MKTMTAIMILAFSLSLAGCVTTQSGSGSSAGSSTVSSGAKDIDVLTKEDYDRIGIKETGIPGN